MVFKNHGSHQNTTVTTVIVNYSFTIVNPWLIFVRVTLHNNLKLEEPQSTSIEDARHESRSTDIEVSVGHDEETNDMTDGVLVCQIERCATLWPHDFTCIFTAFRVLQTQCTIHDKSCAYIDVKLPNLHVNLVICAIIFYLFTSNKSRGGCFKYYTCFMLITAYTVCTVLFKVACNNVVCY